MIRLMDKIILNKYLGKSYSKKDPRKAQLLKDAIDLKQWEINIHYVTRGIDRQKPLLEKGERAVADNTTPEFANVVDHMKFAEYPQALNMQDMFWYIAGYPDVVDFFYPAVDYYPYDKERVEQESNKISQLTEARNKIIDKFESEYFPNMEKAEPTMFEYFIALKDFYKSKHKLLLSKK